MGLSKVQRVARQGGAAPSGPHSHIADAETERQRWRAAVDVGLVSDAGLRNAS